MGKTPNASIIKYRKKAYDQIVFLVPKGKREDVKAYCEKQGLSVNAYLNDHFRQALGVSEEDWTYHSSEDEQPE